MFNWWTFGFQTINFFVVLYILYRLFFTPLKNIIQKRDENIKKRLEKLEAGENKIKEQEQHYQEKLKEIEILKDKTLSIAKKEAEQERNRILDEAGKEQEVERLKQKSILELERKKVDSVIKEQSLKFSLDYIARFAGELIDEKMHQKLIEKFLYELESENANEIAALKTKKCEIKLITPLKIQEQTLSKIKETLENIFETKTLSFKILSDSSLIGGIKLEIENKIIDGSIQGMLKQLEDKALKEL